MAVYSRQECHSTFKRLPSKSDGRNTTSRALRKEWVELRERPAKRDASHVRVMPIHRRCLALLRGINLLCRLGYSEKLHRVYTTYVGFYFAFDNVFRYYNCSLSLELDLFFYQKEKILLRIHFFISYFQMISPR